MSDALATAILAAIDADLEVRLRRSPLPHAPQDVELLAELEVGAERLAHRTIVTREELTAGVGTDALAYHLDHARREIARAAQEPRR